MKINYGVKIAPPTIEIARAFGSNEEPIPLKGGQNTSYLAGNIVLKPAGGKSGTECRAQVFSSLPESKEVRFHRPIKSIHGDWAYEGYVAWDFLKGEHAKGQYDKKLKASRAFHELLKGVPQPEGLKTPKGSWSNGNWVALDQKEFNYDQEFMDLYNQIKPHLKPLPEDRQLVHGDMYQNFLIDEILPPALIDFSGVWAPNGFAEGIMLADAINWGNATDEELEVFKQVPNIEQMAWRGALTRIAEQAEHIKFFGKEKADAVQEARNLQKVFDYLNKNF